MIRPLDPHVSFRRLADRMDGTLGGPRLAAAERHLGTGCATCEARARTLGRIVAAIRAGELESAPPSLDRRVVADFVRLRAAARPVSEATLVGTLILDQCTEYAGALRSQATGARRLLWTLADYEVDAGLVAHADGADLLGQIVPRGDDPDARVAGEIRALRQGRVVARAALAPDGRFTFRRLARGGYTFEGVVDGLAFRLPLLVIDRP